MNATVLWSVRLENDLKFSRALKSIQCIQRYSPNASQRIVEPLLIRCGIGLVMNERKIRKFSVEKANLLIVIMYQHRITVHLRPAPWLRLLIVVRHHSKFHIHQPFHVHRQLSIHRELHFHYHFHIPNPEGSILGGDNIDCSRCSEVDRVEHS